MRQLPRSRNDICNYVVSRAREGRLALLCGAGISYWAPANMPLGSALRDAIMTAVLQGTPGGMPDAWRARVQGLALEDMISRTGWLIEADLERVFSPAGSAPNVWHRLIAKLIRRGLLRWVFTMNFDSLIEVALRQLGWSCPSDYLVVNNERFSPTDPRDLFTESKPTIFHLHGSYDASSMCVTLPHLHDPSLRATRLAPLVALLERGGTLLTIGYSAGDPDVRDEIRKVPSARFENSEVIRIETGGPGFGAIEGCLSGLPGRTVRLAEYHQLITTLARAACDRRPRTDDGSEYHEATVWTRHVDRWIGRLPDDALPLIVKRLGSSRRVASSRPDASIRVQVGADMVRITGDLVLINISNRQRMLRLWGDSDEHGGALFSPELTRRLRSLGYLRRSPRTPGTENLSPNLCNVRELELLAYVDLLLRQDRRSHASCLAGRRAFLRKASDVLRQHAFLHALAKS